MVPLVHRLQENLPSFSFKLFLRKYGWCAYSSLDELFRFKDPVPQILTSGVVYKSQCGLCNEFYYGECVRYFAVRSGDHIGISPLTNKRVRSRKDSATCHHLLNYNDSPIFADFNDLCNENKKYFLKLKESLLIMSKRQQWIRTYFLPLSICLNEFLSQCLLRPVDFCDQFFTYFM